MTKQSQRPGTRKHDCSIWVVVVCVYVFQTCQGSRCEFGQLPQTLVLQTARHDGHFVSSNRHSTVVLLYDANSIWQFQVVSRSQTTQFSVPYCSGRAGREGSFFETLSVSDLSPGVKATRHKTLQQRMTQWPLIFWETSHQPRCCCTADNVATVK